MHMQILIDQLCPETHRRFVIGARRAQRKLRKRIIEVFENDLRFAYSLAVMHQCGNNAARVDFQILGREMLALPDRSIEVVTLPVELLLRQRNSDFLRRG